MISVILSFVFSILYLLPQVLHPLDAWRAFADIGDPDVRITVVDELKSGVLAHAQRRFLGGELRWCDIVTTTLEMWVMVHEYGHCLGIAIGGHTGGIMGKTGGDFVLSNVNEVQKLFPKYEYRLSVSVARN